MFCYIKTRQLRFVCVLVCMNESVRERLRVNQTGTVRVTTTVSPTSTYLFVVNTQYNSWIISRFLCKNIKKTRILYICIDRKGLSDHFMFGVYSLDRKIYLWRETVNHFKMSRFTYLFLIGLLFTLGTFEIS